jgi:phosphatidylglycerophosphate synthase
MNGRAAVPDHDRRLSLADVRALGQGDRHLAADSTYARVVMRRISPLVTATVVNRTRLSADAVTGASIVLGVAGAACVLPQTPATNVLAVLLLHVAFLLDVADGEVARIRRTASKRGSYLDRIGHVLQNQTLYAASGLVLIGVAGGAGWAAALALLSVALALPFGFYARSATLGRAEASLDHGGVAVAGRRPGVAGAAYHAYRRIGFLWTYPASMNLFSAALLVDAALMVARFRTAPLALPALFAVFGVTLAVRQVVSALRLLRATDWSAT